MEQDTALMKLNFLAPLFAKMPVMVQRLRYRRFKKQWPNLKHPTLFVEKIIWMSFHTDTHEWPEASDKYAVRDYVIHKWGSDDILNELYGVWESPEQIDFDQLPQSFVLKTNNACATNLIVRDKSKLDVQEVRAKLAHWLKFRYGDMSGQPHYSKIKPLIIAEKFMVQDKNDPSKTLIDYKFNCFDGKVHSCIAMGERAENSHRTAKMQYDLDWNPQPQLFEGEVTGPRMSYPGSFDKPQSFEQMKEIARVLCQGFKYVRVDLYEIDGKPIFGELSFMPGMGIYRKPETERFMGDLLQFD